MRLPLTTFRSKLLAAMILVIVGVSLATLLVTQRRVQATYERTFRTQFERQINYFTSLQEARLGNFQEQCLKLAQSVRLIAAMNEREIDTAILYQSAEDELREVLGNPRGGVGPRRPRATFFRFVDAQGQPLIAPDSARGRAFSAALRRRIEQRLPFLKGALTSAELQQVGYTALLTGTNQFEPLSPLPSRLPGASRRPGLEAARGELHEVIVTKVVNPEDSRLLGALVLGFPLPDLIPQPRNPALRETARTNAHELLQAGILLEGRLHANPLDIPEDLGDFVAGRIADDLQQHMATHSDFPCEFGGVHYRVFYDLMNENSVFPPAYQVCLYSMEEALREQRGLRFKILGSGAAALVFGIIFSLFLSHGLAAPVRDLVGGTGQIRRGNFDVRVAVRSRDELGELAASFNEMADGLAQKEKYRTILNMVADEKIAQKLLTGQLTLGGELREITVLFCDIRGFTPLTQDMPPGEVIEMLNEHMTALTRVVKEHRGVLDKFVGDLLMAIFGAPLHHDNDALDAASCALSLLEARARLNRTSRHQIQIGIGLATGTVVAGCMGSADRLNYTVLGQRVNLASRLCSRAQAGEVLIDDGTRQKLAHHLTVEPTGEIQLKGFSAPVQAFKLIGINA